jgi:hypothetical protein
MNRSTLPYPAAPQLQQQAGHAAAAFRPVGIRAVAATLASRPRTTKTVSPKDVPAILRADAFLD